MSQDSYLGSADATSDGDGYNPYAFLVWQILKQVSGARLVKVLSCSNVGGVVPVGTVAVQALVNQVDGWNNAVTHGPVYGLPYFRLQGGTNAIIIDPQPGDIGVAIVEDRDISAVKNTKAQANPGSHRIFDLSDGMYVGGFLNGTPEQYIAFSSSGIDVVSPTRIRMAAPNIVLQATESIGLTAGTEITHSAPTIELDGQIDQGNGPNGGNASVQGTLTAGTDVVGGGISLVNHLTTGVQPGSGTSGKPQAGT